MKFTAATIAFAGMAQIAQASPLLYEGAMAFLSNAPLPASTSASTSSAAPSVSAISPANNNHGFSGQTVSRALNLKIGSVLPSHLGEDPIIQNYYAACSDNLTDYTIHFLF